MLCFMTVSTVSCKLKSKRSSLASQRECRCRCEAVVSPLLSCPSLLPSPAALRPRGLAPEAAGCPENGALQGGCSCLLTSLSRLGSSPLISRQCQNSAVPLGSLLCNLLSSVSHLQPPARTSNAPCCRGLKQQPGKALVVVCLSGQLKFQLPLASPGPG